MPSEVPPESFRQVPSPGIPFMLPPDYFTEVSAGILKRIVQGQELIKKIGASKKHHLEVSLKNPSEFSPGIFKHVHHPESSADDPSEMFSIYK